MSDRTGVLCLTLKAGDVLDIGDTRVRVEKYSGRQVRLYISSLSDIVVDRMVVPANCSNVFDRSAVHQSKRKEKADNAARNKV